MFTLVLDMQDRLRILSHFIHNYCTLLVLALYQPGVWVSCDALQEFVNGLLYKHGVSVSKNELEELFSATESFIDYIYCADCELGVPRRGACELARIKPNFVQIIRDTLPIIAKEVTARHYNPDVFHQIFNALAVALNEDEKVCPESTYRCFRYGAIDSALERRTSGLYSKAQLEDMLKKGFLSKEDCVAYLPVPEQALLSAIHLCREPAYGGYIKIGEYELKWALNRLGIKPHQVDAFVSSSRASIEKLEQLGLLRTHRYRGFKVYELTCEIDVNIDMIIESMKVRQKALKLIEEFKWFSPMILRGGS